MYNYPVVDGHNNAAGYKRFFFIPKENVTDIPKPQANIIATDITYDGEWFAGNSVLQEIEVKYVKVNSENGPAYSIEISGKQPLHSPETESLFFEKDRREFIVILVDNNDQWRVCGTLERGLKFSYETLPDGYRYTYAASYPKPLPFYRGEIQVNNELIGSSALPGVAYLMGPVGPAGPQIAYTPGIVPFAGADGFLTESAWLTVNEANRMFYVGGPEPAGLVFATALNVEFNINLYRSGGSPVMRQIMTGGTLAAPTATPAGNMGRLYFVGYSGTAYATAARIEVNAPSTWTSSSNPTEMTFYTTDVTGAAVMRMIIKANGFVGINTLTVTPTRRLTVSDTATGLTQVLGLQNQSNTNGCAVGISFEFNTGGASPVTLGAVRTYRTDASNGSLRFVVMAGGVLDESGRFHGRDFWVGTQAGSARAHFRGDNNGIAMIVDTSGGASKYIEMREVSGVTRIGIWGATPIAKGTITGSLSSATSTVLGDLLTYLHNIGWLTNSTTP